ncbi:hypothetical protein AAY72_02420 [Alishewanella sp. WH16-1]|nr:hypothetical protein AAY72_02420 [Alishewanella sp. WH16-1]
MKRQQPLSSGPLHKVKRLLSWTYPVSQSFDAVNQLRVFDRLMRIIMIPKQYSVAKAFFEFVQARRVKLLLY